MTVQAVRLPESGLFMVSWWASFRKVAFSWSPGGLVSRKWPVRGLLVGWFPESGLFVVSWWAGFHIGICLQAIRGAMIAPSGRLRQAQPSQGLRARIRLPERAGLHPRKSQAPAVATRAPSFWVPVSGLPGRCAAWRRKTCRLPAARSVDAAQASVPLACVPPRGRGILWESGSCRTGFPRSLPPDRPHRGRDGYKSRPTARDPACHCSPLR